MTARICLLYISFLYSYNGGTSTPLDFYHKRLEVLSSSTAKWNDWNFMALIRVFYSNEARQCSGSLIATNWVLTAANCFHNKDPSKQTVFVTIGLYNTSQMNLPSRTGQPFCHDDYDRKNIINDICLVKLDKEVDLENDGLRVLPVSDVKLKAGSVCKVAGWGMQYEQNILRSVMNEGSWFLKETTHRVAENMECERFFRGIGQEAFSRKVHLCTKFFLAESNDLNNGTYRGDSGGPLICDGKQYGIVYKNDLFNKSLETYAAYTKLKTYSNWINTTMIQNTGNIQVLNLFICSLNVLYSNFFY